MSRHAIAVSAILALMLTGTLLSSVPVGAQLSMNNYTAQPISTSTGVLTPNVLFVYDASSSMRHSDVRQDRAVLVEPLYHLAGPAGLRPQ